MTYGYLRVSSDKQDVESQKIGVVRKSEELDLHIDEWISDSGVSGVKEYNKRKLGELMNKLNCGDVIIVSEISRLARSVFMLFRIVEYCNNNNVIIYSVKDSINTIKPNDLSSMMMLFCFGIAAQIERELIVKRTIEGLERSRSKGVMFGRPIGSKSKSKLSGKDELIQQYRDAGLAQLQIARVLGVHRGTLERYCKENGIKITNSYSFPKYDSNKFHKQGKLANEILNNEIEFIKTLIDYGLTNKDIIKKINEKGYKVSIASLNRFFLQNKELYEYYIQKNKEIRDIKNSECGNKKNK